MATHAPSQEGNIPFKVPGVEKACFTYYKVIGDLHNGATPLILLHGGPGAGHNILLPLAELWPRYGVPCVFYDQIGCGSSTHLPETVGNETLWQEQLFIDELNNLIDHLQLRDGPGYSVLGFSWGGMLGAAFGTCQPRGLKRLILGSGVASKKLSVTGVQRFRKQLPAELQQAMADAEAQGDFESPAHKETLPMMLKLFACRAGFPPPEYAQVKKNQAADSTVNRTMNGPSPLIPGKGSLRDWTVIPRLPRINVPTLIYNGEFDSSFDGAQQPFFDLIPNVRWRTFANAGHFVHLETPEIRKAVVEMIGNFLKPEGVAEST